MATSARDNADQLNFDPAYDGEPSETFRRFDLQYYLSVLRKNKWPITLFTALVTGLAAYYAFTATPVYRATATLQIESQRASLVSVEEFIGVEQENSDYYQTQFEILRSRRLARRIVSELQLWKLPRFGGDGVPGFTPGVSAEAPDTVADDAENPAAGERAVVDPAVVERIDGATSWFMANMSVEPLRGTKLVRLSFESEDPELAQFVANSIGEQYIDSYLDSRMEMTSRASSWLGDRLGVLKGELDDAEDRLIQYKQQNGLVDVNGSVGRLNEQELLLATTELAEARSDLASASDIYQEVRSLRGQPELLESIVAIQNDPLIQKVRVEQGQRQRELDELLNRYGERHPTVVDAKSRLASLDATMTGHVERVIGSIEKNYQLLRQRVASIETKLSRGKDEILQLGTKRFELEELEREVDTKRGLYNTFYSRITEAKSADGLETANARLSDLAVVPDNPVKPRKQLIVSLAALASLVLSCMLALLYEQMDSTVKGVDDIEDKLGLKLLGILPLVKGGLLGGSSNKLPLNPANVADKKGTFFESVNTIRTALSVNDESAHRKIIVVTSSVPGEGKSTASMNLAYSLAQLERVLLIDCDMRRPSVAKSAGLDRDVTGLSNLITRTANARQCIHQGVFDGYVDVLPSGPLPEQPLELLSSRRFERVLEHLSQHYDRIIIDSAPTQAVSDALVLSKLADGVIYVIKSHDTETSLVTRGVERLRQVNAPLAGVVITQVDVEKLASYGGDFYYQGYYDYYGYNSVGVKGGERLRMSREELRRVRGEEDGVGMDDGLDLGPTPRRPERIDREPSARESGEPTRFADAGDVATTRVRGRRVSGDLDIL